MTTGKRRGRPPHDDLLTPTEWRIVHAVQHGMTNRNIAEEESILYMRVVDIEQAHQELQARGVQFTSAPHMIHKHADGTEEWMAFFKDPEGRPLAIMSQA